ncbi:hypothetical protein K2P47_00570 [Patescibacteria group bacterium]|nr:hypothetical protein [Patescibacteria group bacterium]
MFDRTMVIGYLATVDISPEEKDAIRMRLGRYVQPDGTIMAGCLQEIFSNHEQHADFIAAWESNPGKFLDMSNGSSK